MKFILNRDNLSVDYQNNKFNSGSIKYYEAEVEFDGSWEDLIIEARIVDKEGGHFADEGNAIAVINNKIYIDRDLFGNYGIGFIGYTVENEVKTYQISTNLVPIYFSKGAGEIEAVNGEDVPNPTEWEIYISQIQDMLDNYSAFPNGGTTGQALVKKTNADGDVEWKTIQGGGGSDLPDYPVFDNSKKYVLMLLPNQAETDYELKWKEVVITTSNRLITSDNFVFKTADGENFILKEDEE